ncbi:MAG: DUF1499 domain-containing protein [Pseudomonadales bacterium]|nr:DUF1499 domain-containing protein [Pseudomonadales bacterium]
MSESFDGQDNRRWWAKALLVGAVVGLVALPIGALGSRFGIWPFMGGFALLGVGVVLATIAFFLGVIGAVYANSKGLNADRKSCLIAVVIGIVILGLMGNQFMTASGVPPIHNISTDTLNPPEFDKIVALREAEGANPLAYDAAQIAEQQRAAYPYVKPLVSGESPNEMFGRAVSALESLGMEVVSADEADGIIEATDTTFWFGFKDDVAIRIRGEGGGSVVDIRSVSRVGQSDLGKNAERIGQILNALGSS